MSARCRTSSYVHACDQRSVRRALAPVRDVHECPGRCHAALSTHRMAPPPGTIGRSPLHVATPLRPCHAHAATPLLTTVVTPSPRRTSLYKRPSPLQSSASAVLSFFSCPPWPPVGELLLLVASISFRPCLSLPTSPRSPTEACTTASCRTPTSSSPESEQRRSRLHSVTEHHHRPLLCRNKPSEWNPR
jgi:hypothetical protein